MSKYNKTTRDELYQTDVIKIKEKDIFELIVEINEKNENNYIKNEKQNKIYKLIYKWKKKENYFLSEYIEIMFLSLSFINKFNDDFAKFQIYSAILKKYLSQSNLKISFDECEINITDDKWLDLIIHLFEKSELDDEIIILSLIILKFNSLKESIKDYSINEIFNAIKNTCIEINNRYPINSNILIETIIMIFCEEMDKSRSKNKKNKNKKIGKKKKNKYLLQCTSNKDYYKFNNINQNIEPNEKKYNE